MTLYIQDPLDSASVTLHETLIYGSSDAQLGAGAFAFATAGGIKLLFDDNDFAQFVDRAGYELIVGIDEITNPNSLATLERIKARLRNLSVLAFLNDEPGKIFHPKFSWFKTRRGGILIVGSGNLTVSGLRGNWEAMSFNELDKAQFGSLHDTWVNWKAQNAGRLKQIDDQQVILRAGENLRMMRAIERRAIEQILAEGGLEEEPEDISAWEFNEDSEALIAEIPRAGSRWNQVNFDKQTFVQFFGAVPGDNRLIILFRSVSTDGRVGNIESRPSVTVRSRNFRFELEAAAGLDYPAEGRPLGVFIRVSKRMFFYTLTMPDDPQHEAITRFLDGLQPANPSKPRRHSLAVGILRRAIPDLPIWDPVFS